MEASSRSRRWLRAALGAAVATVGLLLPVAPAVADGAVTVWDTSGKRPKPCPAVDAADPRELRGGCVVEMNSHDLEILIRTVLGDVRFGTCLYEHQMRVDGAGRTYLENMAGGGPSPCNDIDACYHRDILPQHGQIEAAPDGRLTHVVDACFDTCMGQFIGELRLGLERVNGRWEQTADKALVGDSGYRIDGGWNMEERNIDIRPAPDSGSGGSDGRDAAGAWLLTSDPVGWPI